MLCDLNQYLGRFVHATIKIYKKYQIGIKKLVSNLSLSQSKAHRSSVYLVYGQAEDDGCHVWLHFHEIKLKIAFHNRQHVDDSVDCYNNEFSEYNYAVS
jgi:hypothetical protein